jgi:hypothetical protein
MVEFFMFLWGCNSMTRTQAAITALQGYHLGQGHVLGRKWSNQRLPVNLILAIREISQKNGVGPAAIIEDAMNQSSYGKEYRRYNSRAKVIDLEGQQVSSV